MDDVVKYSITETKIILLTKDHNLYIKYDSLSNKFIYKEADVIDFEYEDNIICKIKLDKEAFYKKNISDDKWIYLCDNAQKISLFSYDSLTKVKLSQFITFEVQQKFNQIIKLHIIPFKRMATGLSNK